MDRPADIVWMAPVNGGAIRTIGGVDPESLVRLSQALFAEVNAQDSESCICGLHVAGGGNGADWQLTYTLAITESPGWTGLSVNIEKARVSVAIATDPSELDRSFQRIVDQIVAESGEPPNGVIYNVQIAGGGRDGAYLLVVLWAADPDLPPYLRSETGAEQGPFSDETNVLNLNNIPGVDNNSQRSRFLVLWGGLVNETAGAQGVYLRLYRRVNGGAWTLEREAVTSGTGLEWARLPVCSRTAKKTTSRRSTTSYARTRTRERVSRCATCTYSPSASELAEQSASHKGSNHGPPAFHSSHQHRSKPGPPRGRPGHFLRGLRSRARARSRSRAR